MVLKEGMSFAPMNEMMAQALGSYELCCPQAELIRHNENMTYRIDDGHRRYVLRIHKPIAGFSLDIFPPIDRVSLVENELAIVADLGRGTSLRMQLPVPGKDGAVVQALSDGTPVSLLTWVEGRTVETLNQTPEMLRAIGMMTAKMHLFSERQSFGGDRHHRRAYDQSLLRPIAERIRAANALGTITDAQRQAVMSALDEMRGRFGELDRLHPQILTHADLSKSNMIVAEDGAITPIDFSLSGYSHFYMDIGGLFGHITNPEDRRRILEGYKEVRNCEILPRYVEPYFAMQVILFVACQYERAAQWDWFGGKMQQWCEEIFQPLAEGRPFL